MIEKISRTPSSRLVDSSVLRRANDAITGLKITLEWSKAKIESRKAMRRDNMPTAKRLLENGIVQVGKLLQETQESRDQLQGNFAQINLLVTLRKFCPQ